MKKETIIAITLGIGLGVVVAIFLVIKNRQLEISNSKTITTALSVTPTPATKDINVESLELTEPATGTIVNANSIHIKGKVAKDSLVIIQSSIKTIVQKQTSETFDVAFPLAFGENAIHITVYPKDQQLSVKEKDLQIYYLDEQ